MFHFSRPAYVVACLMVSQVVFPHFLLGQDSATQRSTIAGRVPLVDLGEAVVFEVSPHTGMMGSSGTFGVKLLTTYSSFSLEIAAEQVIGKTANLYPISLNALLNLATKGRLIPYGCVGAGLWLTVPTNALGAETISTLGLNFGGGARYFITRSFGIRLEAKQYFTSVSNPNDSTDELLFFQEFSIGVTFMFR